MAVKHFLISPDINPLSKEEISKIESEKTELSNSAWTSKEQKAKEAFEKESNLKHTFGRVIVKVDTQSKNYHSFGNGLTIRRERNFNEFNRRITQPSNAIVISGEGIDKGSEILISHNSIHDTNRIFDYRNDSPDIHYLSIPEYDCFAWRDKNGVMQPMKNYEFGLRIYRPYTGRISFITPVLLKDVLYITTGSLKGKVVHTLKASDYEIVFQDLDGQEGNLIRFRHSDDDTFDREEVQAINHELTEQVNSGILFVGITEKDCKNINE